ncbi:hypothetical protein [Streptomyces sp. NPDC008121]|uniref:hypothetical protein n=1 Tax=Streptomyces sp. NPDC008121 TaxID=3364809 RepID=UPI0036EDA68F
MPPHLTRAVGDSGRGRPAARRGPLTAVAAAALLALAGCSDDGAGPSGGNDTGVADDAAQAVCESLDDLRSDASEMAALEPSDTVEDIEDVRSDLAESMNDVEEAAEGTDVRVDGLRTAYDRLSASVARLAPDATGPAAQARIAPDLTALTKALTEAENAAGCTTG